ALFRELNRLPPEPPALSLMDNTTHPWALRAPAHTEDERLCRQVIEYVAGLLRGESEERAEAVVARLEAEYREELCRHGLIRLLVPPALPPARQLLEKPKP